MSEKVKPKRKTADVWSVTVTRVPTKQAAYRQILARATLSYLHHQHPELWGSFMQAVLAENEEGADE